MKKIVYSVLLILAALAAYLALWPVPVNPVSWQSPENPGYLGDFAVNQRLDQFAALSMGEHSGPEAAIVDANGDVVATSHEGWLVKFEQGEGTAKPWVDLAGRPLGLDIANNGDIWVANAYLGLQKVTPEGQVSVALDTVEGTRIRYADDVVVTNNGKVYFTDATTRFPAEDWGGTFPASVLDILEHGDTGRVIEYDPSNRSARVILSGLNFANGITADADGEFLLVNETGEYRVWKVWLQGQQSGRAEVIVDNLPGFPDNISRGMNGYYWLGLVSPRSADIDKFSDKPFWRKVIVRLPQSMHPKAEPYGMVVAIDETGKVLQNLQEPKGQLYATTGVVETEQHIYITSLTAPFLGKVKKADAGLK